MVTVYESYAQFRFYRPKARTVSVAGDFNGWRSGELRMVAAGDGYWVAAVRLPPGRYAFRYCADGEWFCDFAAFGVEPGPFGWNSVLRVPPRVADTADRAPALRLRRAPERQTAA